MVLADDGICLIDEFDKMPPGGTGHLALGSAFQPQFIGVVFKSSAMTKSGPVSLYVELATLKLVVGWRIHPYKKVSSPFSST